MRLLSRRDFLKLSSVSLGAAAWSGLGAPNFWPPDDNDYTQPMAGRVSTTLIYIYREPNFRSQRTGQIKRDTVVPLVEEVIAEDGPAHNPLWYRIASGYVYSAYLQRVEQAHHNKLLGSLGAEGRLAEITVPFSQSFYKKKEDWRMLYRLYYGSVHWITQVVEGPDGEPWYQVSDDWMKIQYYAPAVHFRPIEPEELAPISPEVPKDQKKIEVSITDQVLTAYEGDKIVLTTKIASGLQDRTRTRRSDIPTDTPLGRYFVEVKVPCRHMGDCELTSDPEAYELVGVPWVSFFHPSGVAFHGCYWHNNFGRRMSHGCVNMRNADAKWLYRWCGPYIEPSALYLMEHGSLVHVYE